MDREAIRRWASARSDAARRERAELVVPNPAQAVRAGLDLLDVVARLQGWPLAQTANEQAEDERVRRVWSQLRDKRRIA